MGYQRGRYIPSYGELTAEDYAEMGMKSGLEVHQQLMTKHKLFCKCPAGRYEKEYDAEILRHMRPTLSELGEYDATALMEFKTKKEIIYQLHKDTVCTYEMDDAPPFELNREAMHRTLVIALQFHCNIVGEIHIARKQYLDGSIPAGFQRTMILGTDGWLPYDGRKIQVVQLALEEDACREMADQGHYRYYRTDRLSTPLIEVVTAPEMHTPWDVMGVGNVIRKLTRATGLMRRGAGSGRQDVNVSVAGGERVEIKGVCSIRYIPQLVHYEALRQRALLDMKEDLISKGLSASEFKANSKDVTEAIRKSGFEPALKALSKGGSAAAVRLPLFREALVHPTGPHANFALEISERLRVIACLHEVPNIVYRDMVGKHFAGHIWKRIENVLGAKDQDGIIVVWGSKEDVKTAVGEIELRAKEALIGIPRETRQAHTDGGTGFERMLPGPDRMYPDTDMPPIALTQEHIELAKEKLVIPPWEWEERLADMKIPLVLSKKLIDQKRAQLAERVMKELDLPPKRVAYLLSDYLKHLARKGGNVVSLADEDLYELFALVKKGELLLEAVPLILEERVKTSEGSWLALREKLDLSPLTRKEAEKMIPEIIKNAAPPRAKSKEAKQRYYTGVVSDKLNCRLNAKELFGKKGLINSLSV